MSNLINGLNGRRRRVASCSLTAICAALLFAPAAQAQFKTTRTTRTTTSTKDFAINGIEAWSTARTNGFTFRPMTYASGQSVSRPYDGVNTRLYRQYRDMFGRLKTVNMAAIVGGNPNVSDSRATVTFELFGGQTLAPGWSIQSVQLSGSYVWDRRVQAGSQNPSFRIKVTGSNSVTIRSVTLRGPSGANWQDAFVGRKTYTLTGIDAWSVAKQYGFQFTPTVEDFKPADWNPGDGFYTSRLQVTSPADGVNTQLLVVFEKGLTSSARCARVLQYGAVGCAVASVVGGNASVHVPIYDIWRSQTIIFEMFAGKRLAQGWTVRQVELSSGSWLRRPAAGSDDLSMKFSVTSYVGRPASALVRTVVLEGPSNATGWQNAFRDAQ